MRKIVSVFATLAFCTAILFCRVSHSAAAGAADPNAAKRPHPVPLAFYLSGAVNAEDQAAISAAIKKAGSVSSVEFNATDGYVRVVFDSHAVSYQQIAQAIADAGAQLHKRLDPRIKFRIPEYASCDNARQIDALLAGKRLNQRVHIEVADKAKGEFVLHFLPLVADSTVTGPQGFNGGHLNHPLHDPPPRGLGLTCTYDAGKESTK